MPGWTWIAEDKPSNEPQSPVDVTPVLDRLAQEWTSIASQEEQRGWQRQADAEDGLDHEPDFDTEEEAKQAKFEAQELERFRQACLHGRIRIIEEELARHGARMMRPYEHWNEDERIMEYMERDRD